MLSDGDLNQGHDMGLDRHEHVRGLFRRLNRT